jgi:hypothetical protein
MKQYILKDLDEKAKELKRSFQKAHKIIVRAQKKVSRTGKDKSLLKAVCQLGFIVNKAPITLNGKKYVNPMTSGDKLFLEEVGTFKYVEFFNNIFLDVDNKSVYISFYSDDMPV